MFRFTNSIANIQTLILRRCFTLEKVKHRRDDVNGTSFNQDNNFYF